MTLFVPDVSTCSPPELTAEDDPPDLQESEDNQEMTAELPFVGGPRPTMTKLKVNYYISSIISHHALPLCVLQTYLL